MLSVVIPVINEENQLRRVLPSIDVAGVREVIVVDGGSSDQTCGVAEGLGARVIRSSPGRGIQMAAGARIATEDVVLFLHADTLLPTDFVNEIRQVLGNPEMVGGAFQLGIDVTHPMVRVIEFLANIRCRVFNSPYGDQGIFVRRKVLESLGGVPEVPLLEDVKMVKNMKSVGRIVVSSKRVSTSGRSWTQHGTLKTTAANLSTCVGYMMGVDPVRLAVWRRKILPPTTVPSWD